MALSFINSLLVGLFTLIATFFQALTRPLWNLAGQNFPDFVNLITYVMGLLNMIVRCIGWVINCLGLEPIIHMICLYWIAYITLSVTVWGIKIVLRWYRIIMP